MSRLSRQRTLFILLIAALLALGRLAFAPTVLADDPCPEEYTVKFGDTLGEIADNCETTIDTLRYWNPAIQNTNRIYMGQKLIIHVDLSTPEPLAAEGDTYIVQRGDTLSQIAVHYGTTLRELMRLNPDIEKAWLIFEDQVLVLPEGARPAAVNLSTGKVYPGGQVTVNVSGYPGYAKIDYRIGPIDEFSPYRIIDGDTNVNGEDSLVISIPNTATIGDRWQVTVSTTDRATTVRVQSHTILIVPLATPTPIP